MDWKDTQQETDIHYIQQQQPLRKTNVFLSRNLVLAYSSMSENRKIILSFGFLLQICARKTLVKWNGPVFAGPFFMNVDLKPSSVVLLERIAFQVPKSPAQTSPWGYSVWRAFSESSPVVWLVRWCGLWLLPAAVLHLPWKCVKIQINCKQHWVTAI